MDELHAAALAEATASGTEQAARDAAHTIWDDPRNTAVDVLAADRALDAARDTWREAANTADAAADRLNDLCGGRDA